MTQCPRCGGTQLGPAEIQMSVGLIGVFTLDPKTCLGCGWTFDRHRPDISLQERHKQLQNRLNLIGGIGILLILAGLAYVAFLL